MNRPKTNLGIMTCKVYALQPSFICDSLNVKMPPDKGVQALPRLPFLSNFTESN